MSVKIIQTIVGLWVMSVTGCGRAPGSYAGFEEFVDSFVSEGRARGWEVDVYGVDIKVVDSLDPSVAAGTIGLCDMSTGRITLLKSYWNSHVNDQEELIFHELGHCALGKEHTTCPNVMCAEVIGSGEYMSHRPHYLDVLFTR